MEDICDMEPTVYSPAYRSRLDSLTKLFDRDICRNICQINWKTVGREKSPKEPMLTFFVNFTSFEATVFNKNSG